VEKRWGTCVIAQELGRVHAGGGPKQDKANHSRDKEANMRPQALKFSPYDVSFVHLVRAGGPDSYGNPAERVISDGGGNPCRSCLDEVPKGAQMLIVAARPFDKLQPYAETGPIFLCADCAPYNALEEEDQKSGKGVLPPVLANRAEVLLKGYTKEQRIVYGTGKIVQQAGILAYCAQVFKDEQVAFIDARSAVNNCFTVRIIRDEGTDEHRI
jgi:hypothetical protein